MKVFSTILLTLVLVGSVVLIITQIVGLVKTFRARRMAKMNKPKTIEEEKDSEKGN